MTIIIFPSTVRQIEWYIGTPKTLGSKSHQRIFENEQEISK